MNNKNENYDNISIVPESKRKFHRVQCKAKTLLTNLDNNRNIECKCTNISISGIGVEICSFLGIKFIPQDTIELRIHLPNSFKPIHRFGKLIWMKRTYPFLYVGGIGLNNLRKRPI